MFWFFFGLKAWAILALRPGMEPALPALRSEVVTPGLLGRSFPFIFFNASDSLLLFSHSVVSDSSQSHELHHARLPCPSPNPGAWSDSCPLSPWCHPTILSSVVPFSSCPQSFLASGSFPMSRLFRSGGQSIGGSAPASILPMNIQGWFPLGWTGLISLLSKWLWRVFSNTIVWKYQWFLVKIKCHNDDFHSSRSDQPRQHV